MQYTILFDLPQLAESNSRNQGLKYTICRARGSIIFSQPKQSKINLDHQPIKAASTTSRGLFLLYVMGECTHGLLWYQRLKCQMSDMKYESDSSFYSMPLSKLFI